MVLQYSDQYLTVDSKDRDSIRVAQVQLNQSATTLDFAICTAGLLAHWHQAGRKGVRRLLPNEVHQGYSLTNLGLVFVWHLEGNAGHTGVVEGFRDDRLIMIEGSTHLSGGREDLGVLRQAGRKLSDINKGFISYES